MQNAPSHFLEGAFCIGGVDESNEPVRRRRVSRVGGPELCRTDTVLRPQKNRGSPMGDPRLCLGR